CCLSFIFAYSLSLAIEPDQPLPPSSIFVLPHTGQRVGLLFPERNSLPFSQRHQGGSNVMVGRCGCWLSFIGFAFLALTFLNLCGSCNTKCAVAILDYILFALVALKDSAHCDTTMSVSRSHIAKIKARSVTHPRS